MSNRRVVITGLGLMTPIGLGADAYWANLKAGVSGIGPAQLPQHDGMPTPDGAVGEVSEFNEKAAKKGPLKVLRKNVKVMCREIQLGAASALEAVKDAGLDLDAIDHTRLGVSFGANLMSSEPEVLKDAARGAALIENDEVVFQEERWGEHGFGKMQPLWLLRYLPNMPACHIGIAIDARGPNNSITVDEASGNLAISEAMSIIQRGCADMMIAGSTGTRVHPVKSSHIVLWDQMAAEPADPTQRVRPFELNRKGEVAAEGSGSFLLEDRSHAEARGAKILGEVLATAGSCVMAKDGTANQKQALVNVMKNVFVRTGLTPGDIGHINAHGCGSQPVDSAEAAAIHEVFGDLGGKVPVTAMKSYFGNAGSGCGQMEMAASLLGLAEGVIPPTRNYDAPDPDCNLNVVAGEPLATDNKLLLKLNVTRMGQASASIVSC